MVHMVIKMKNQLKRRGSSTWKNPSSGSLWRPNFDVDDEEYIAQGELLVLRRTLSMQVKEDDKVQ
ncbi:hypothetical protein AAG906_033014 [Vitis piasezkii]